MVLTMLPMYATTTQQRTATISTVTLLQWRYYNNSNSNLKGHIIKMHSEPATQKHRAVQMEYLSITEHTSPVTAIYETTDSYE